MKVLLDENISPHLVAALSDVFPRAVHVRDIGLARATDAAIWVYARDRGLTIVSKDSDFHQGASFGGPPPKVIWIRRGNCSTADIKALLRSNRTEILAFGANEEGVLGAFLGDAVRKRRSLRPKLDKGPQPLHVLVDAGGPVSLPWCARGQPRCEVYPRPVREGEPWGGHYPLSRMTT